MIVNLSNTDPRHCLFERAPKVFLMHLYSKQMYNPVWLTTDTVGYCTQSKVDRMSY